MNSLATPPAYRKKIENAIAALESQRVVLGDEVADLAIASLQQELREISVEGGSQRKQVSVLFADLVGFTALVGDMDAEEVLELVNALWQRLDRAILLHGGTIDKHVGDGVMALFGVPIAQEDDPIRAVLAGQAMLTELRRWVNSQQAAGTDSQLFAALHMRIGINTGPVLFGPVGSAGEMTAMGDTVNIASRLEAAAPVDGILIADETWHQVAGRFDGKPLSLAIKGRAAPLKTYVIESEKSFDQRTSGRGVAGVETRTVGREMELARLCALFDESISEGKARIITVVAEAGIGKSRLLQEFSGWLQSHPQPTFVLKARADAESERHPYWLVRESIASKMQISNSTPAPLARERLINGLTAAYGDSDPGMAEFIGQLIGLDFSFSDRIQNVLGDAQQIRARSFQYLARFFGAVCAREAAVVLLEDVHWADEGSLDIIEYLVEECKDLPLFVLCLARPNLLERRPNWAADQQRARLLALEPLSTDQSALLVGEILRHVPEIPPRLVQMITATAGGNAFYIEEMIKVLIEDGVIVPGADEWRVHSERLGELRVPPTLTALLQARIDRLPPAERELLQRAAVVGKVFWNRSLHFADLSTQPEPDKVSQAAERRQATLLANLAERELVRSSLESAFEGAQEYRFHHAILHEVVYESVLLRRRRLYHQRVAEWLIWMGQDRVAESAGLIGEHFARAEETVKAAEWFAKAGHQARKTYLPQIAIDYYVKALDQFAESDEPTATHQHMELYGRLGEMLFWQARYDQAITAFQAMDRLAEQMGNFSSRSQAWNQLSLIHGRKGSHREAIECAVRAAAYARQAASDRDLIQAMLTKASALLLTGNGDKAEDLCRESLELSAGDGLEAEKAQCYNLMGRICDLRGDFHQSIYYKEEALERFRLIGDRRRTGWVLHNLGVVVLLRGDYKAALDVFRDALQIAVEIGDRDWQMAILANLGSVYVGLEAYAEAAVPLQQVVDMAQGRDCYFLSLVHATHAEALLGMGRIEDASRSLRLAQDLAEKEESLEYLGYVWRVRGLLCSHMGQSWRAGESFTQSKEFYASIGAEAEVARTLRDWAVHLCRSGSVAASLPKWQESRILFERLEMEPEIRRLDQLLLKWSARSHDLSLAM